MDKVDSMHDIGKKVIVAVRIRPKNLTPPERYESSCVQQGEPSSPVLSQGVSLSSQTAVNTTPGQWPSATPNSDIRQEYVTVVDPSEKVNPSLFAFDKVFDEGDRQEVIYHDIIHVPVQSAITGNGDALFVAYGQTGSGKTHTMLGDTFIPSGDPSKPSGGISRPSTPNITSKLLVSSASESCEGPDEVERGFKLKPEAGVLIRVMNDVLLAKIAKEKTGDWHFVVTISAVEVYNDVFFDLLPEELTSSHRGNPQKSPVEVREITGEELILPQVTKFTINSSIEIKLVIDTAMRNRSTAHTKMNDMSSRSHAIFKIEMYLQRRTGINPDPPDATCMAEYLASLGQRQTTYTYSEDTNASNNFATFPFSASNITVVDLAGSERIKKSGVSGRELAEAVAVNKSLSALGNVVRQICDGSKHVSYRESKLTRVLKPSFSDPKSNIVFITTVSPTTSSYNETISSLRFASRLKEMRFVAPPHGIRGLISTADEDEVLKRMNVLEKLCSDYRIATHGDYPGHVLRSSAGRSFSFLGRGELRATLQEYAITVKKRAAEEEVLLFESSVQDHLILLKKKAIDANKDEEVYQRSIVSDIIKNRTTDTNVVLNHSRESMIQFLQTELEVQNDEQAKIKSEIEILDNNLNKDQEFMRLYNAKRSDYCRKLSLLDAEESSLDDQMKSIANAYSIGKEELQEELQKRERDDAQNSIQTNFAELILAHNKSKIAVLTARIDVLRVRGVADKVQQEMINDHTGSQRTRCMVDVSLLEATDLMDIREVVQLYSTPSNLGRLGALSHGSPKLVCRIEALSSFMDNRLLASNPSPGDRSSVALPITQPTKAPFVSPILFYFSPGMAIDLSRGIQSSMKYQESNNGGDMDDGEIKCPLYPYTMNIVHSLIKTRIHHGKLMKILDEIHADKFLKKEQVLQLYTILEEVPLDLNCIDFFVQHATKKQEGRFSNSDSDDSVSSFDGNTNVTKHTKYHPSVKEVSSTTVPRATKMFLRKLISLDTVSPKTVQHNALIRFLQAYTLFATYDRLHRTFSLPNSSKTGGFRGKTSRSGQINIFSNPLLEIVRRSRILKLMPRVNDSTSEWCSMVKSLMPADDISEVIKNLKGYVEGSITTQVLLDLLSYESIFAFDGSNEVLQAIVSNTSFHSRDLSHLVAHACKIVDSTSLLQDMNMDTIPHMPSCVRFTEVLMICCDYR